MADPSDRSDTELKYIAEVTRLINAEIQRTANLLRPHTSYSAYRPYDPTPVGAQGNPLNEIGAALRAIHTNLFTINKMIAELLPQKLEE